MTLTRRVREGGLGAVRRYTCCAAPRIGSDGTARACRPRRRFQRLHGQEVGAGPVAHPGDTRFGQLAQGRRRGAEHDVERQRGRRGEAGNRRQIAEAGGKEPVGPGIG